MGASLSYDLIYYGNWYVFVINLPLFYFPTKERLFDGHLDLHLFFPFNLNHFGNSFTCTQTSPKKCISIKVSKIEKKKKKVNEIHMMAIKLNSLLSVENKYPAITIINQILRKLGLFYIFLLRPLPSPL